MKTDQEQIKEIMQGWADATFAKDADRLIADYDPNVLVCDLVPPLSYVGADRYQKNSAGWFQGWDGPIRSEMDQLALDIGGDVAFTTILNHISGTRKGGEASDFYIRVTLGFRRVEGKWKVVLEHVSVPFDMETMQASLNLQPE